MQIGNFEINQKAFIVAELSANHNNNLDIAIKSLEAIKRAGADAVKLQTYKASSITLQDNSDDFIIKGGTLWDGLSYYDLYDKASTPYKWHKILKEVAERLGLILFSSPFDKMAVDFLEELNMPAYKIASFEINDLPLIEYVAKKNKPVIMSTGVASFDEIKDAVDTCRNAGNNDIILLKCTSSYPAPIEEANLFAINRLQSDFNCLAGLSDHTLNNVTSIVAVTLGACVIEKHFILDKSLPSPDRDFSLDEIEFRKLVDDIRQVEIFLAGKHFSGKNDFQELVDDVRMAELALGQGNYNISSSALKNRHFMRSLYVIKDMKKGDEFTEENIASFRPNLGISPKYYFQILGKKAKVDIQKNTPLKEDMIGD